MCLFNFSPFIGFKDGVGMQHINVKLIKSNIVSNLFIFYLMHNGLCMWRADRMGGMNIIHIVLCWLSFFNSFSSIISRFFKGCLCSSLAPAGTRTTMCCKLRWLYPFVISFAINSACFKTVSVANFCKSGG